MQSYFIIIPTTIMNPNVLKNRKSTFMIIPIIRDEAKLNGLNSDKKSIT